jgi:diguanylate cyclase (GGDEF)-like protein
MMQEEHSPGFVVACDSKGCIREVVHDQRELLGAEPEGSLLSRFVEPSSLSKLLSFLVATKLRGASFGCEVNMQLPRQDGPQLFYLAALHRGEESTLLFGVSGMQGFDELLSEMTEVCNQYATEFRRVLKEQAWSRPAEDEQSRALFEDLARLNNELVNTQRELVKKNRDLEQANEKINQLMRADPLTGVANRRALSERMEESLSFARRHEMPLSLVMCDLDHFKSINDTFGHKVGDEVLAAFGTLMRKNVRGEDLPARFGGEEFVVLLPATTEANAAVLAERLRQGLIDRDVLQGERSVTASFGVAQLVPDETGEDLLRRADQALYAAKSSGRNQTVRASSLACGGSPEM